ncbi:MAG: Asp-tRNA(Asn)/Glu-tRNA(Gln) amidotransferase subunit GatC [Alphaproteobacteria bacterium]|nr:Asp-tRNA(Asn)/Glu-tRNA(Gln) amidotransferase subunit GatC [Alphaproteobacteria bacterium]OJV12198.1 MAG: hypothetical protein BGO27_05615 [Alphaproteobacteria bacterium 33-17]
MAEITVQEVNKIARLARIKMNEEDAKKMSLELSKIFEVIDMLQEVNTDNVKETINVIDSFNLQVFREDSITDGNKQEDVLKNAKDAAYGCYAVPKVIE